MWNAWMCYSEFIKTSPASFFGIAFEKQYLYIKSSAELLVWPATSDFMHHCMNNQTYQETATSIWKKKNLATHMRHYCNVSCKRRVNLKSALDFNPHKYRTLTVTVFSSVWSLLALYKEPAGKRRDWQVVSSNAPEGKSQGCYATNVTREAGLTYGETRAPILAQHERFQGVLCSQCHTWGWADIWVDTCANIGATWAFSRSGQGQAFSRSNTVGSEKHNTEVPDNWYCFTFVKNLPWNLLVISWVYEMNTFATAGRFKQRGALFVRLFVFVQKFHRFRQVQPQETRLVFSTGGGWRVAGWKPKQRGAI